MQDQKTQQFAKFYIKDLKTKTQKDNNKNSTFDELNIIAVN
tara:strand:- start:299 stop:421 length:123 start_codon:yes stop_codon:yes gene_type:complete